ncbi:MAG TPA: LacI family DNA-binding transcriptional regulator [Anaerolineaceae bacterium]|nr:LacI family DNA-binding transcriptional regulator [Anaerolineaceae bacterium]HPN50486.1 LacI family DNA-binding transcriptional regulator [Anaerolineaceae bacterium]
MKKTVQTIADIARMAGVSKSTVSRALNDSPLIAEETKARIRAIAHEHHFQINLPARRLSLKESRTLALVIHAYHKDFSVADLFTLEIMGGIANGVSAYGYDLLIVQVDPRTTDWVHAYIDTGRVDGFILMTSSRKKSHIQTMLDSSVPFVIWGPTPQQQKYCTVMGDNFAGGKLAGEHLVKIGRKRIAFLGGPPEDLEVQRRYDGFLAALQAGGQTLEPERVGWGDFCDTSGGFVMREILQRAPDVDAVFVNSDLMAVTAMQVLREEGRRVPEDVAVVGYDDLSISRFTTPQLTTVRQHIPMAGRLLAQTLIQYLQTGLVNNVTVPVELVERQSA